MDIQQLRYFITVATYGSIQDAADELFVSRQAVSRAILSLEREINEELFVRTYNGIHLTSSGKKYVDATRALVEQFDELYKMMSMNQQKKIVDIIICFPISLYTFFINGINEFKEKYPIVNLKIVNCTDLETHEYLLNHKADMIVTWTKDKKDYNQSYVLFESSTYFVVNENNHLANNQMLDDADIQDSVKIYYTDGHDLDFFKDPFYATKDEDYFISDIMTVYDMVDQNIGIFPLPEIAIPLAKKGYKFIKYSNPNKVAIIYCEIADNLKIDSLKLKYCNILKEFLKNKYTK